MDATKDIEEHLQAGEEAYNKNEFQRAVEELTKALDLRPSKESEARICNVRSRAFTKLCKELQSMPAELSERRALYGLDPKHLALLASKDADKALAILPTADAFHARGHAHFHMESYVNAQESFVEALRLAPSNPEIQAALREVEERVRTLQDHRGDEFDCTLCLKLYYEPVTTPCGHTFCRSCLARSLDHSSRCPICRTVLYINGDTAPVTIALKNIIEKAFPDELTERREEMTLEAAPGGDQAGAARVLPLFVMDVVLPGQSISLNIFEPRYRLMVRRVMEGNRMMGMAVLDGERVAEYATELEIKECEPLPDGRFFVQLVAQRRVRVLDSWQQDGYRVGKVEGVCDTNPDPAPPTAMDAGGVSLEDLVREVDSLVDRWLGRARAYEGRRGRLQDILSRAGNKPTAQEAERYSFWAANLLPLGSNKKLEFLSLTDSRQRLEAIRDILGSDDPRQCSLM